MGTTFHTSGQRWPRDSRLPFKFALQAGGWRGVKCSFPNNHSVSSKAPCFLAQAMACVGREKCIRSIWSDKIVEGVLPE